MTCHEFIQRYSEFSDGRLPETEADRFRAHTLICRRCERYDRVIREGRELLSGVPDIEPSHDFRPRLQHRIFHLREELKQERSGAGTLATMGVATFLLTAVWSTLLSVGGMPGSGTAVAPDEAGAAVAGAADLEATRPADDVGFERAAGAVWVDARSAWWHEHDASTPLAAGSPSGGSGPLSSFWRLAPAQETQARASWPSSRAWSASFSRPIPGLDGPGASTYSPLLTGPPAYQAGRSGLRLITSRAARD